LYIVVTVLLSILWCSELMASDVDKKLRLSLWTHAADEWVNFLRYFLVTSAVTNYSPCGRSNWNNVT